MKISERILHVLEGQQFADWYSDNGNFGRYIKWLSSKEKILQEIRVKFGLTENDPEI